MKRFRAPEIEFVCFKEQDLIVTSTVCQGVECDGYVCTDCPQCAGAWTDCLVVTCGYYVY